MPNYRSTEYVERNKADSIAAPRRNFEADSAAPWQRAPRPMTARSTSRSRASCCCPCGLAPVVTVAAGTTWGDATPCYASHHMMLVLLYGLAHNTYPTLKLRPFFHTKTKISRTHTRTDFLGGMYPWWELETRFARIIRIFGWSCVFCDNL